MIFMFLWKSWRKNTFPTRTWSCTMTNVHGCWCAPDGAVAAVCTHFCTSSRGTGSSLKNLNAHADKCIRCHEITSNAAQFFVWIDYGSFKIRARGYIDFQKFWQELYRLPFLEENVRYQGFLPPPPTPRTSQCGRVVNLWASGSIGYYTKTETLQEEVGHYEFPNQ